MRRNGMHELLTLTGTSPLMIWFSRAAALLFVGVLGLSATWPMILIAGAYALVPFSLLAAYAGLTVLLLLYLLSLVLLASSSTEEDGLAYSNLLIWGGISSYALPVLLAWLDTNLGWGWLGQRWELLAPVYGCYRISDISSLQPHDLWLVFLGVAGWTVFFFWLCAGRVRSFGTVRPQYDQRVSSRLFTLLTGWSAQHSEAGNPLAQLVKRERKVVLAVWGIVLLLVVPFLAYVCLSGLAAFKPADYILVGAGLVFVVYLFVCSTAERIMAEARRTGLLELVLTAGLPPPEILRSIHAGVVALYSRLIYFLTACLLVLAALGAQVRTLNAFASCTYCVAWVWLFFAIHRLWFGSKARSVWIALNLGRPSYSVGYRWVPVLGVIAYLLVHIVGRVPQSAISYLRDFPFGNMAELIFVGLGSFILLPLSSIHTDDFSDDVLLGNFRQVAAELLPDPRDSRIEKWDTGKPFPAQRE